MPSHSVVYHRTDEVDDRAAPEVPLPADRTSSSTLHSGPVLARRMIFSLQKLKRRLLIEWRQRGMWPSLPLAVTSIQARHLEPAVILIPDPFARHSSRDPLSAENSFKILLIPSPTTQILTSFGLVFNEVEVYPMNSSKTTDNFPYSLELEPVVSQT
jgi:hypothetical protein